MAGGWNYFGTGTYAQITSGLQAVPAQQSTDGFNTGIINGVVPLVQNAMVQLQNMANSQPLSRPGNVNTMVFALNASGSAVNDNIVLSINLTNAPPLLSP